MKILIYILLIVYGTNDVNSAGPKIIKIFLEKGIINLHYRALTVYQKLDIEDYQTIDAYRDKFFNSSVLEKDDIESINSLIKILKIVLVQNKISKKYIPKLTSFTIALNSFKRAESIYFDTVDILWLLELRNIEEKQEIIKYLQQSLSNNSENELILKVLINENMYQQLEKWFKEKDIKHFSTILELLKRQDKITNAFKNNNENISDLLIADYKLTIEQVFNLAKTLNFRHHKNINLFFKHYDWLFLQFNEHKEVPTIKNILLKLEKDWLFFNAKSILKIIPKEYRYEVFHRLHYDFNVFWKIKEINELGLIPPKLPKKEYIKLQKEYINNKVNESYESN